MKSLGLLLFIVDHWDRPLLQLDVLNALWNMDLYMKKFTSILHQQGDNISLYVVCEPLNTSRNSTNTKGSVIHLSITNKEFEVLVRVYFI